MNSPTPAIVAQSAVRRLPRIFLLLLCLAYVLPGTLLRAPWRGADITAYGYMHSLLQGHSSWWTPRLLDLPPETQGLLPYWIGAASMQWLGPWMDPVLASRLPFVLLLIVTLATTWYGTYWLARSNRAQPVTFAFGGEAQPADYARAIADGALLALLACLGLAQPAHEGTAYVCQLAGAAVLFYGLSTAVHRPLSSLITAALGWLLLVLSGAPVIALLLSGGGLFWLFLDQQHLPDASSHEEEPRLPLKSILLAAAIWGIGMCVLLAKGILLPLWAAPDHTEWGSHLRLNLWFFWPAWPLVGWTLWRWRHQWLQRMPPRHLTLPLWFTLVITVAAWGLSPTDRTLLLALPTMAILAAWALPTLNRSVSALIDWFTLLFFSVSALAVWVIWLATQTGVPAKPAANVAKLAPMFVPSFSLAALLIALLATLAWFSLVAWRVGRHRPALWKSLVLPAGGTTLCWLLLLSLWLPMLNYARNDAHQVERLANAIQAQSASCVIAHPLLDRSQIAALNIYTHLSLARSETGHTCQWMVTNTPLGTEEQSTWTEHLRAPRATGRDTFLFLYRRHSSP